MTAELPGPGEHRGGPAQHWSSRARQPDRRRLWSSPAGLDPRRRRSAPLLEEAIVAELADLGMTEASVQVALQQREGWEGLRESGARIGRVPCWRPTRANRARSLARTASGGELSRVLLALKCALAGAGGDETLVFDEIDAGIGGRTARPWAASSASWPALSGDRGDPSGPGGGPGRPPLPRRQGRAKGVRRVTRLCLLRGRRSSRSCAA